MKHDRYLRHSLLDWLDEGCVRAERLVVVGAGAIGNEVVKNLVLLGVGEVHVFDLDRVESHNLPRAVLFREDDVGKAKAECAAARARDLDGSVRVVAHEGDFWDRLDFDLLRGATGVFGCVDNLEARVRLNRLCALAGRPWINAAIDSRMAVAERVAPPPGGCYECGLPSSSYAAIAERFSCGGLRKVAREERVVPTTILTASLAASLAVSLHFRTSPNGTGESVRVLLDTFTGRSTVAEWARRPGCPGCGDLREPRFLLKARALLRRADTLAEALPDLALSDAVVTHVRCRACGLPGPEVELECAARHDERLADCPSCGPGAREVGVGQRFRAAALAERFDGCELPVKYVLCDLPDAQVVFELEHSHERSDGHGADGGPHTARGGDSGARADGR